MNKALFLFLCVAVLASLFTVSEGQRGYIGGGYPGGGGRYGCMCRYFRCRYGERTAGRCYFDRYGGYGGLGRRGYGMGGYYPGGYRRYVICCPRYGPYF